MGGGAGARSTSAGNNGDDNKTEGEPVRGKLNGRSHGHVTSRRSHEERALQPPAAQSLSISRAARCCALRSGHTRTGDCVSMRCDVCPSEARAGGGWRPSCCRTAGLQRAAGHRPPATRRSRVRVRAGSGCGSSRRKMVDACLCSSLSVVNVRPGPGSV